MPDDMSTTLEQIETYLGSLEDFLLSSLQSVAPDLPRVNEAFHRLWEDVSRFGPHSLPSLPQLHLPSIGPFEVPPPPPPPPPKTLWEKSTDWASDHPWKVAGISIAVVGTGLLVGYSSFHTYHRRTRRLRAAMSTSSSERRQVVVLLGADHPLGLPLVVELEKSGYIVIISVSSPDLVEEYEKKGRGYVRALVLDPADPETIPFFLRSMASTMSRRFPMTSAGDPHSAPATQIYVHSVISLLTFPTASTLPPPAPLEHLSLRDSYLTYLQTTHITPLEIMQAMMPLMRTSTARARDAIAQNLGKKSIIVCVPAIDARVGVPFAGAQAMSAAATLRGVEVLRREIKLAAWTDATESMRNIKVVTVDVGAIGAQEQAPGPGMDDWTPGEKLAYGGAFSGLGIATSARRAATDPASFVETIIDVVSSGRKGPRDDALSAVVLGIGKIRELIFGDRLVLGAGGHVYAVASHLPAIILDALLNLPHFLLSVRNGLLPVHPRVPLDASLPPVTRPLPVPPASQGLPSLQQESPDNSDPEPQADHTSEASSEADVESNEEYASGVSESWVSLSDRSHVGGEANWR